MCHHYYAAEEESLREQTGDWEPEEEASEPEEEGEPALLSADD